MRLLKNKIHTLAVLCLGGFSGSVWALQTHQPIDMDKQIEFQRVTRITKQAERSKIITDTENTFTLLGAEIALERGQSELALNTYLAILRKTKDPEVAERAMELAVSLHQYELARDIYEIWQEIQPESSPAQRRIAWANALALGDLQQTFEQLDTVIQEADELRIRRIFLLLSQVSLQNPDMVRMGGEQIHNLAWQYADMPEAMISEIIYSSGNRQTKRTLEALKKLSQIDQDLSYVSRLALSVLVREQPDILFKFFDKNDSKKLSHTWQELEIENLIQAKRYREAQTRLQELLEDSANVNLYFLAASQAEQQQKNSPDTLIYLEKAYQHGSPLQKSRAATLLANSLIDAKKFDQAETWLNRIQANEFEFNKNVLQILLATQRKNWNQAIELYQKNSSIAPNFQYSVFTDSDREMLYLYAAMQARKPQTVLLEINRMLKDAEKQADNRRISALLYQRGLLYSDKLNRVHDAIADFRRHLAMNPDNAMVQNSLGYILLSQPKYLDEAADLISKAYQKLPEDASINDSMGWVYFLKSDYQTAQLYLEFAYKNEPVAEVAAHLGEVYWMLGEHEKAKTVWKEGWQQDHSNSVLKNTLLKYQIQF